ncbi:hypothetical protein AAFC00_000544 [Neodothiora populina]|uniref:ENTH domain-containing protein n=1 Tax=Neodothiora populina TaxID=2781224 RepID=A0ABR3PD80_9PEZI
MSGSFEKSVKGGTKIKAAPPKSKYVEHILLATHAGEAGVAEIFRALKDRLRDSTWTIVFKSLIIIHLMIKEGEKDVTLSYLAQSPRSKLAINTFTDVQTQGQNIRRYSDYLIARAQGFADTKVDYVRSGTSRMKNLPIEKGLLRETECIQAQIKALVKCDLLDTEPENEISLTAFRLLTKDLLDLFAVMNEAVMNVLSHYFELSKVDAEHAIGIYKTFAKQTDQVVQYLSVARQYEHVTKLEIPKIKHAPTSLAASLQEYIDDNDFEVNRRQYLAEQQAKGGNHSGSRAGKFTTIKATNFDSRPSTAKSAKAEESKPSLPPIKSADAEFIDFFDSIERQQQQPAPQQQAQQQAPAIQYAQPPAQQFQPDPFNQPFFQSPVNGTIPVQSTNPYGQPPPQQFQQPQSPPQPLQPDFTGAGFGGYGPQPQQQPQQVPQAAFSPSNPYQNNIQQFPQQSQDIFGMQQQQQQQVPQIQQPPQQLMQPPSTNPFRQSMMLTGQMTGFGAPQQQQQAQPLQQQSTNPFARAQQSAIQGNGATTSPQLQPQPTGTNPFARQTASPPQQGSPSNFLTPSVTGSTNPFRQSAFVNQQTGQGWQNAGQATLGGWEQLETTPVFPRPGQA